MESENPEDSLASINRRSAAALIDCAFLGLLGVALLLAAGDRLAAAGPYARLIGLPFAVAYLTIGAGRWMEGQTAGKALLGLRLVCVDGRPPGTRRAIVRSLILVIPWFVGGLALDPRRPFAGPLLWAGAALWGVAVASAYLYATSSTHRQFLHDLVAGTFVVRDGPFRLPSRAFPRTTHLVVAAGLLVITMVATRPPRLPGGSPNPIDAALLGLPGVTAIQWTVSRTLGVDPPTRTVRLQMTTTADRASWNSLRLRAGAAVLTYFPEAARSDRLEVKTQRLLDVGLASWTVGEASVRTPEEWRAATESERAALLHPAGR
jgi:uncharacterized RDD family membrane protein YckC